MKLYSFKSLGLLTAISLTLSSCSLINEDLEPCPTGVNIHFSYTRNILGVEAFEKSVDCAQVHVYDEQGKYFGSWSSTGNSNLLIDLPAGRYHTVVYGGMDCDKASFVYNDAMGNEHHYSDLVTQLKATRAGAPTESSDELHPMFHGTADFTVEEETAAHTPTTVSLTKNTNNLRVTLQHADGSAVDPGKFDFYVTADNTTMDHRNEIIRQGTETIYRPYATGTFPGILLSDGSAADCAYADISTVRLLADGNARFHLDLIDEGKSIVNLDMVKYFEMIRGNEFKTGSLQDYLDCQDNWRLVFMLDPKTEEIAGLVFKVNDWTVNLSNSNMEF